MFASLVVALVAAQSPHADVIRGLWTAHDLASAADEILKASRRPPSTKIPGVTLPAFGGELRAAGPSAIDLVIEHVTASNASVEDVLQLAARMWDVQLKLGSVRRIDLDGFQRVCDRVFRDLRRVLGSGRDLDKEAPRLHGAVDHFRKTQRVDQLGRDEEKILRERLDRMTKVDKDELLPLAARIVEAAFEFGKPDAVKKLLRREERRPRALEGVEGMVLLDRDTSMGRLVVGGAGNNRYDCTQVDMIIDAGGDDVYTGPAGGAGELRRMSVVLDMAGDDTYEGLNDALGSATFGIGVLIDLAGKDTYKSAGRSAGFGTAGVGVFIDAQGIDEYELGDQSGGVGLAGIGIFADLDGDDVQTAGVQSFGCGLPGGLGLFFDGAGDDKRKLASLPPTVSWAPRPTSVGFGTAVGVPELLAGGLGVCLDVAGNDIYSAEGLVLGVGVGGGVGVFRDVAGGDEYTTSFGGLGATYQTSCAVFVDDEGDDSYHSDSLALGAAAGDSVAWFLDRRGNDSYTVVSPGLGEGRGAALATFLDLDGNDTYNKSATDSDSSVPLATGADRPAVGVFLDSGGAADIYSYDRASAPQNGKTRRLESGTKPRTVLQLLVDR